MVILADQFILGDPGFYNIPPALSTFPILLMNMLRLIILELKWNDLPSQDTCNFTEQNDMSNHAVHRNSQKKTPNT